MVSYKVSYIVLNKSKYENDYDFEEDIKNTIMMLLRNEQILVINKETDNIVVIEHETEHEDWGANFPRWLSPEEDSRIERNGKLN